jgi:hypothetical protein
LQGRRISKGFPLENKEGGVFMLMRKSLAFTLVGVMALLFAGSAMARSVPGTSGRAFFGSQETCFNASSNGVGWITNANCGTATWVLPLPIDNAGSRTVTVTVFAPDTNATRCFAEGVARTGGGATVSNFLHPSVANQAVDIVLTPAVSSPGAGMLYVQCDLGPGASITTANFNP